MTCHEIQHELNKCCAQETTKLIEELGSQHFAILVDESVDVYQNEQLAFSCVMLIKKDEHLSGFLVLFMLKILVP